MRQESTVLIVANYENTVRWSKYYAAFKHNKCKPIVLCFCDRDIKNAQISRVDHIDFRTVKTENTKSKSEGFWDFNYSWNRQGIVLTQKDICIFVSKIKTIIKQKQPLFFFGEKTWPYEIKIASISNEFSVNYLTPVSLRIPDNYYYFSNQYEIPINVLGVVAQHQKEEILTAQREVRRPSYFNSNNAIAFRTKAGSLYRNIFRGKDEYVTRQSVIWRILNGVSKARNSVTAFQQATDNLTKFCYYVHVQPEASIDYLGCGFRSNEIVLDWISYAMGTGIISNNCGKQLIALKYHPNFRGQFQGIKKHHYWISKNTGDSIENLKNGIVPITISGTIALESLWMGISPIVLGRPYFREFPGVIAVNSFQEMVDALLRPSYDFRQFGQLEESINNIINKSFDCTCQNQIDNYVSNVVSVFRRPNDHI